MSKILIDWTAIKRMLSINFDISSDISYETFVSDKKYIEALNSIGNYKINKKYIIEEFNNIVSLRSEMWLTTDVISFKKNIFLLKHNIKEVFDITWLLLNQFDSNIDENKLDEALDYVVYEKQWNIFINNIELFDPLYLSVKDTWYLPYYIRKWIINNKIDDIVYSRTIENNKILDYIICLSFVSSLYFILVWDNFLIVSEDNLWKYKDNNQNQSTYNINEIISLFYEEEIDEVKTHLINNTIGDCNSWIINLLNVIDYDLEILLVDEKEKYKRSVKFWDITFNVSKSCIEIWSNFSWKKAITVDNIDDIKNIFQKKYNYSKGSLFMWMKVLYAMIDSWTIKNWNLEFSYSERFKESYNKASKFITPFGWKHKIITEKQFKNSYKFYANRVLKVSNSIVDMPQRQSVLLVK